MTAKQTDLSVFLGWTISGWSLEYQLLRVRFHLFPSLHHAKNTQDLNENLSVLYRGEGLFSRPSEITFEDFYQKNIVEEVSSNEYNDSEVIYILFLDGAAKVKIKATNFLPFFW
jgi:hypothetical protein